MNKIFLKIIYGSIFCILLPALLINWANFTDSVVQLPVPGNPFIAIILIIAGVLLMLTAMLNLWRFGKGLPMNAFPPEKYVSAGAYKYFHHPIYVAAILLSFGISMCFKSPSGFWLVNPIFILMIIAYVTGFENEIINTAFGNTRHKTFFDLPKATTNKPTLKNRLLLFVWIYLPWFIIYELFIFMGEPKDAVNTFLQVDDNIPYLSFTVLFYILGYPFALAIPFIIKSNRQIKEFVHHLTWGMIIIFLCYIAFPFIAKQPLPAESNFFDRLVILGRETDGTTAALPSFHVFWALISYYHFSKNYPKLKIFSALIAVLITISCATTKNHSIADILSGIGVYFLVINLKAFTNQYYALQKVFQTVGKNGAWGQCVLSIMAFMQVLPYLQGS